VPKKKTALRLNLPHGWAWPPTADMKTQGARCLKDLDTLGVKWKPGKATAKIATPVVVEDMDFAGLKLTPMWGSASTPYVMDCHLARALARWAAPALLDMHVVELRFGQIHKYRQVAGKPGVLSRHALGLAMDVVAFVTDDGEVHVVKDGYPDGDEVLLEVEKRIDESGAFRLLFTPGNDPKHHDDHYHFEARAPGDKPLTPPPDETTVDADDHGEGLLPEESRDVVNPVNAAPKGSN
jgi:hypothetical protein